MKVKKAGCVLINRENRKIALVHRIKKDDYSFPKGHWEDGETLQQCAVRETEEETGRKNHLIYEKEISILKYITSSGEDVENYMYLAQDDGESEKVFPQELKEELVWVDVKDVEEILSYPDLKEFWRKIKSEVENILDN